MNRYQFIPKERLKNKVAYRTSRYPEVPLSTEDIYVYTSRGDRFDILAQQYYGDSSLWWVISIANTTLPQNSLVIPYGIQIRIPADPSSVIRSFNAIND